MLRNKLFAWSLIVLAVLLLIVAFYKLETGEQTLLRSVYGVDYVHFFSPALHTSEPYEVPGFYNPFWVFAAVWFSELFGAYKLAAWVVLNLCCYVWVCVRMKMPLWTVVPYLVFSGALMSVYVGNVEGIVALGLVLPPPVGIILLMMKPQIGMAVAAYYVLSAFIYSGWKKAAQTLVPVLVLFALSFVFYGDWFFKPLELIERGYNTIFYFPIGVPVGIALIVAGVSRRNIGYALMAIPFTAPYMIFHTWAFPFMGVVLVLVKELAILRTAVMVRPLVVEE